MQRELPNENELLKLVAEGDENAFGILVHSYSDLLGTHIYGVTHSREQTEEIVQDVFLKIWMARESLVEVRKFRTWLYVISKNQAVNALNKVIRERTNKEKWLRTANETTPEQVEEWRNTQLGLIDEAIASLPPQQQKVYLLSRKQGLKYKEIAQTMRLSSETVKKYIHYAVQSIVKYVETRTEIVS